MPINSQPPWAPPSTRQDLAPLDPADPATLNRPARSRWPAFDSRLSQTDISPTMRPPASKLAFPVVGQWDDLRWSFDFIRPDHYLLVRTQGPLKAGLWHPYAKALFAVAQACQCPFFLVDHRQSSLDFSSLAIYDTPEDLRNLNAPPNMAGAVVFARPTDLTRLLHYRLSHTNLRLRVFHDLDDGKDWLLNIIQSELDTKSAKIRSPPSPTGPNRPTTTSSPRARAEIR
jgi:hypothetical protein